jgi:glycerol-3-phosphate O-acyltransferase/dihydroxyacetone phosphate acyltransferase
MNQFVDGAMIMVTNPHHVSILIAEKSFNEPIVGDFAKALGAIPVSRPQDSAKPGPGTIKFEGLKLIGEGTAFTQLGKGDRLRPGRSADSFRIK